MIGKLFEFCILVSVLPVVAQQPRTIAAAQWQYVREDDPLHAMVHDRFILEGVYLTPPRLPTKPPSLVVECSGGKVEQNYFNTGVVVVHRDQSQHGMLLLEERIDNKKSVVLTTGVGTDGLSVFFTRVDLKDILSAKHVIVGVYEYMGGQVVMQFDIPDPSPVLEKCGSDRILKPRVRKVNAGQNDLPSGHDIFD
jgi:hypothetical protein